jgi:hypothetical protein
MTKIAHITAALLMVTAFCTRDAIADPIQPFNPRPVAVNTVAGEAALQTLVDSALGAGIDVAADQSTAGMWAAAEWPFGILASLAFEYAGNNQLNTFGLWSGAGSEDIERVSLFLGAATGVGSGSATDAAITWDATGTQMTIEGDCTKVNCGTFAGIDPMAFGFYLQVASGAVYYSLDALNAGLSRAVAYQQGADPIWAIGFEDWNDGDFNDGMLKIQSATAVEGSNESVRVAAVPEPVCLLLVGTGLGACLARRRLNGSA